MQHRLALVLSLSLAACGGGDPGGTPDGAGTCPTGAPSSERYFPLSMGASWTYDVTDSLGGASQKTQTVQAFEDVGGQKAGVMAFRLRTTKPDGDTVSWQADTGCSVVRHREQSLSPGGTLLLEEYYEPHKLRVDEASEHVKLGASWVDNYVEKQIDPGTMMETNVPKSETWTVESVDEQVTVPAGTFTCLRVRRVGSGMAASDKTFWFAKGVGKVKEEGGQIEELASYNVP